MMEANDEVLTDQEVHTLERLLAKLSGQSTTLPRPLFRFVTEVAATANVDILVRDNEKGVLLAWRDDPFGKGWHVPGSIVRHREEIQHRLSACAADEFGCELRIADQAIALIQIFDDRGHSISICYTAELDGEPGKGIATDERNVQPGDLKWFRRLPQNIYPSHAVYRELIRSLDEGDLVSGVRLFTQHTGRRDASQTSLDGEISSETDIRSV